jgi:hypothetical protein
MADITNGTNFRALEATRIAALYFFTTLHGTGGSALAAGTAYSAGVAGELATGNGYTQGGNGTTTTTPVVGSVQSTTNVQPPTAVWTATSGSSGSMSSAAPVSYATLWACTDTARTGAVLVMVKDVSATPQSASTGQTVTVTEASNAIQY